MRYEHTAPAATDAAPTTLATTTAQSATKPILMTSPPPRPGRPTVARPAPGRNRTSTSARRLLRRRVGWAREPGPQRRHVRHDGRAVGEERFPQRVVELLPGRLPLERVRVLGERLLH